MGRRAPVEISPHDAGSEQTVLGAAFHEQEALQLVLTRLTITDFYGETERFVFRAITNRVQECIDKSGPALVALG